VRWFGRPAAQFTGVYLHNGGPPGDIGQLLWTLVHFRYQLRVAELWRELIEENPAGWSSLSCFSDAAFATSWDGRSKQTVDERSDAERLAPVSFQGDPKRHLPGIRSPPIHEYSDKWGAVWVHVVTPEELVILEVLANGVTCREHTRVVWREPEPEWSDLT
jgi:hypothetical protein